jgi:hypothetical protein
MPPSCLLEVKHTIRHCDVKVLRQQLSDLLYQPDAAGIAEKLAVLSRHHKKFISP